MFSYCISYFAGYKRTLRYGNRKGYGIYNVEGTQCIDRGCDDGANRERGKGRKREEQEGTTERKTKLLI